MPDYRSTVTRSKYFLAEYFMLVEEQYITCWPLVDGCWTAIEAEIREHVYAIATRVHNSENGESLLIPLPARAACDFPP